MLQSFIAWQLWISLVFTTTVNYSATVRCHSNDVDSDLPRNEAECSFICDIQISPQPRKPSTL